jgi:hypothetical protein
MVAIPDIKYGLTQGDDFYGFGYSLMYAIYSLLTEFRGSFAGVCIFVKLLSVSTMTRFFSHLHTFYQRSFLFLSGIGRDNAGLITRSLSPFM